MAKRKKLNYKESNEDKENPYAFVSVSKSSQDDIINSPNEEMFSETSSSGKSVLRGDVYNKNILYTPSVQSSSPSNYPRHSGNNSLLTSMNSPLPATRKGRSSQSYNHDPSPGLELWFINFQDLDDDKLLPKKSPVNENKKRQQIFKQPSRGRHAPKLEISNYRSTQAYSQQQCQLKQSQYSSNTERRAGATNSTIDLDKPIDIISTERRFICEDCNATFKRLEHMIRHRKSHYDQKDFECDLCKQKFSRKDNLAQHKRKVHKDNTDK